MDKGGALDPPPLGTPLLPLSVLCLNAAELHNRKNQLNQIQSVFPEL
jgi:hypothetical protein